MNYLQSVVTEYLVHRFRVTLPKVVLEMDFDAFVREHLIDCWVYCNDFSRECDGLVEPKPVTKNIKKEFNHLLQDSEGLISLFTYWLEVDGEFSSDQECEDIAKTFVDALFTVWEWTNIATLDES